MSTVNANKIANVTPGVLTTGGAAFAMLGLLLTTTARVPIGTVASFSSPAAVGTYFGLSSDEKHKADIYFAGFLNSRVKPAAMKFAQYNTAAVGAFLRGGNVSALTLAQLQAISGSLNIVIDGYAFNAASVNLGAATSFSSAAGIIQTAINAADPTEETVTASIGAAFTGNTSGSSTTVTASSTTGLISVGDVITGAGVPAATTVVSYGTGTGGNGTYVLSAAVNLSAIACVASSTVLDVTVTSGNTIAAGQYVTGSGVTASIITAVLSGTGGVGLYRIAGSPQHVASESMIITATPITVTYDSVSGGFLVTSGITGPNSSMAFATGTISDDLDLIQANGAVLSQGAAAATPNAFMTALTVVDNQWGLFSMNFDPDAANVNTNKLLFSAWTSSTDDGYAYIEWDANLAATVSHPASGCFAQALIAAGYQGTSANFDLSNGDKAAFIMGAAASIDFTETNGRTDFDYLQSAFGLTADVSTDTAYDNLIANGYNFYAAFGSRTDQFVNYTNGSVSGDFTWLDSYVNQLWLNSGFQDALISFRRAVRSVPYNSSGRAQIQAALKDQIDAGLNFGAYVAGVQLSASQIASITADTGDANAATTLSTQGWFLQVLDADPATRLARGSPPMTFWYTDGESVQSFDLASINVQ